MELPSSHRRSFSVTAALIGLLAAVYFGTGKLGLSLATVHASATAVWPPTAVALAALLLGGYRLWPGIFLGAFLVNITTEGSLATCLGIAAGNTLEGLTGAWLINRFAGGRFAFSRARTLLTAVGLAGILSTTVSATLGVTSLALGGSADWNRFGSIWLTWWLGDAVAVFVLAPVLILWTTEPAVRWPLRRRVEAVAMLAALCLVGFVVFVGWPRVGLDRSPVAFLCLPVLLWPALRFGPRETASCSLALSGIALFGAEPRGESLMLLQAFMAVTAALVLTLSGVVAERAQTRGALGDVEARNAAILECSLDAIVTIDHQGNITEFNPAAERIFGFARADVLGRPLAETIIPPSFREAHRRGLERARATGEGPVLFKRVEMTALRADGSEFPVELAIVPVLRNGRPPFFTGYLRDITERKRAREDLEMRVRERTGELSHAIDVLKEEIDGRTRAQEAVRLYTDIVQSAHIGMMVMHLPKPEDVGSFQIVTANPAAAVAFGIPTAPFVARALKECFPRAYDLGLPQIFAEVVRSGRPRNIGEVEYGDERIPFGIFSVQAFPLPDRRVCVVFENVTERKRLERERELLNAKLLEGQKLQAIGELAAGVAHEINNPTAYILSNLNTLGEYFADLRRFVRAAEATTDRAELDRLRQELRLDFVLEDFEKAISDSREGGERIREIVRSLKEFSHADEGHVKPTDLNEALESAVRICWNEIKYKATIKRDYADLPPLCCYPQRISQVFMNLLVNAAQAIQGKGEIVLITRRDEDELVVQIKDSGPGIPPANMTKLFEPFFTTKPVGKGTGLGLHVAHKVVRAHGGRIDVESQVGCGTTFTVRLPLNFTKEPLHDSTLKTC